MALANDYSSLVNKIENRLGLKVLSSVLPPDFNKDSWVEVIKTDTMPTFSRYFPRKLRFVVNNQTCNIRMEDKKRVYYIKDELLGDAKLLGVIDIDWQDTSADNISINNIGGMGYYVPNYGGMEDTFNAFTGLQMAADLASLYNNNIFVDFDYPNKIIISRAGNLDIKLDSFVVNLLVEHSNLQTISPTKMETFEALAQADIARYLYMNLRYFDGLETIYVNIDLKLNELEQEASKRESIIEEIKNAYVSPANDNIPYVLTISG
jgi:hypothetical protein